MIWWMAQNFVMTAVLAGCVWAICRIRRVGPAAQHALWLVLLVKLITPPVVSWPWALSRESVVAPASVPPPQPNPASRIAVPPSTTGTAAQQPGHRTEAATRHSDWIEGWLLPTMVSVWLSGGAFFVLLQGGRIRRMLRLLRASAPAGSDLVFLVQDAARRVRTRPVDTRVAAGIASPFIWCLHRPRLLWPLALSENVPAEAVRGLLVHELAHLKRRDHWVGWIELAAGCLWWWNPLYWYIRRQLRENAELACDAWVVDVMDSFPQGRRAYAEALLSVCESMSTPMTAVGANTSDRRFLERRLTMIVRERVPLRLSRVGVLIVALVAAGVLPMWTLKAAAPPAAQTARTRTVAPAAPPAPQGLPNDAEDLLKQFEARQAEVRRTTEATLQQQRRQLIARLQALQDTHTRAGRLDEAVAVRDEVRRLQGIAPADSVAEYVDRVGQNIASYSEAKVPFTIKVIPSNQAEAVSLPGGFFYVNSGLIVEEGDGRASLGQREVLLGLRDQVGETIRLRVTGSTGWLWGTDVYTLDSEVGAAAVHAGFLQPGEEGIATIRILPGRDRYSASMRNGLASSPFGSFIGSFAIERVEKIGPAEAWESGRQAFFSLRRGGQADVLLVDLVEAGNSQIMQMRGSIGETLELDVTGSVEGTIWGTDVYTGDSPVEVAAVHAGLLRPGETGKIRVTIMRGRPRYESSRRNGIMSEAFDSFDFSYRLERMK
jgi:beta-lactamase regulating signal transducer with metallopeptidase domain